MGNLPGCLFGLIPVFSLVWGIPTNNFTTRAPRTYSVASVTELGPITQNSYVVGRDNGQSAYIGGKSYWFFDDTTMTDSFLSNTGAVTSDLDASNGVTLTSATWTNAADTTSRPQPLIWPTDAEIAWQNAHARKNGVCTAGSSDPFCGAQYAVWPGAVFADPDRDRIIIAYGKLCRQSIGSMCSGGLGWQELGWGFYQAAIGYGLGDRLQPSTGGITDATGIKDPALFGDTSGTAYNSGAVVYGGYVYLYGGNNLLVGGKVARVPLNDFTNMSKWTYWNGSFYQNDANKAAGVLGLGAAGNTVFYNPALEGFFNFYMPIGSNTMYMQSAAAPEGPWSSATKLFDSVPANGQTNYAGFAHPEYASANGLTQYVTYYQTGTGVQRLVKIVLK